MGLLPKNERIVVNATNKKKIWIYGAPFSGKTYLANQFPDMLLLSTDGNYTQLPKGIPPHIDIKDIVTVEGRITKKQFAWEIFKETISELEKKQNDFKTIVVDLIEDTYEYCRLYMYDKLGIEHESDDSFRAWDKVRTEFLSTIKRLTNLNYDNIILISHEDTTKDLTKRTGDKVTSIKPNLQDKAALKIAGMMDIVCRVVSEDGKRILSFKTSEVIFGGGRLNVKANEINCNYDELIKIYDEANGGKTPEKISSVEPKPEEIAEKDRYFYHCESDCYLVIKKGEKIPTDSDFNMCDEITKQEYEEGTKRVNQVNEVETAAVEPVAETPERPARRSRRTRTSEETTQQTQDVSNSESVVENVENNVENSEPQSEPQNETPNEEEQPKRRTRKKRTEN